MIGVDEPRRVFSQRSAAWVVIAAAFLLFVALGDTPVERTSEKRCHAVAVTMLESGDFLVPYYDGEPRLQKPPLYYWLAAASAASFGGPNGFTTRLPSALAALATALLLYYWSRRRFGDDVAFCALAFLVTMNQFPSAGRRGDAETMLMFSSLLSLVAFHRFATSRGTQDGAILAVTTSIAALSKATAAILTVLIPVATWLWRGIPRPRGLGAVAFGWLTLGMLAGLSWYGVVAYRVPGAFDSLFGDLVLPVGVNTGVDGDAEHYRGWTYYLSKIVSVAAPATIFLPALVWRLVRTKGHRDSPALRFIWLAFAAMFVAFSILPQKQRHYLLPMLPLLSILLADSIVALARELPRVAGRVRIAGAVLSVLLGIFGVAWVGVFLARFEPPSHALDFVATAAAGLGASCAGFLLLRGRVGAAAPALVVSLLAFMTLHEARIETFTSNVDFALENDAPVLEADRLYRIERESPWLLRLYDLDGLVEDLHERDEELGIGR